MAQEYLPAPSNVRLADLMKEHNITGACQGDRLLQKHYQPLYQRCKGNPVP